MIQKTSRLARHCEPLESRTLFSVLTVRPVTITEPNSIQPAEFVAKLDTVSNETVTLTYFTSDAGAKAGKDYVQTSGKITIKAGRTHGTFTVPILPDDLDEPAERFFVNLHTDSRTTLANEHDRTQATIIDNDPPANGGSPPPTITIAPATAIEGNTGTTTLPFVVTLSAPSTEWITVRYATLGGTASSTDYNVVSGTLVFNPGVLTQTIGVTVKGDTVAEADETLTVRLSNPTHATLANESATGTIFNDDTRITLSLSPKNLAEDASGGLVYSFTRTGVTNKSLVVNFAVGGTATYAVDYTTSDATTFNGNTGTVTFGVGATNAIVFINPTADVQVEPNETVRLTLLSGTGYTLEGTVGLTGTIVNDDAGGNDTGLSVIVTPATVTEDVSGGLLVYTFTRTGVTTGATTVNFTVGGTATFSATPADSDYALAGATTFNGTAGTIAFPANVTDILITVDPTTDAVDEPNETVIVAIAPGAGYGAVAPTAATGTILDDDGAN